MEKNITGIILSGGNSSRMGTNKSLLEIKGKTVIENVVDLMQSVFSKVIIITNTPEVYRFINLPIYTDIYKNKGPLAGIYTGLSKTTTDQNFIISCDMPLMTSEMIEYIINFKTKKPVTVCKAGGFTQMLAGKYSKLILQNIEELLISNNLGNHNSPQNKKSMSVFSLLNTIDVEIIDPVNKEFYNDSLFFNMNSPEDYKKILTILND